ncbi:RDD family protein [Thermoanaerobacterium thermosaccharolyticum]|uniref:RDD family protein n=1 Tax=Thermoanaerobacterium thermosaccharolyticum TaxID=1517 RepID=UPI002FDB3E98
MKYAGFWRRTVAYLIDTLIMFAVLFPIEILLFAAGLNEDNVRDFIDVIAIFYIFLYFTIMESSKLQATLGKMVMRIKVTDLNGNRITFGRAVGRFLGKILSGIILNIGFFMAGWTKHKQALHDIISGCLVVKE